MNKTLVNAAMAVVMVASAVPAFAAAPDPAAAAAAADERKRLGSFYLRCDGQPNNVTGAETFARLLGAVTLLGLFAPAQESPDPAKRLFAEKGVEACSKLLDDPGQEGNAFRRLPLILARAVHQIEAKNYPAAIADVTKARGEANALGVSGNPYFERSMGLSFDVIESEATLRQGDAAAARAIGLRSQARMPYSFYAAVAARPFPFFNRQMDSAEEQFYRSSMKIDTGNLLLYTARLEEAGRFGEAAELRDALLTVLDAMKDESSHSALLGWTAITHALAGHWDKAQTLAEQGQANVERLAAEGKPEGDASRTTELFDFYHVLALAHEGKIDDARRNFAARSEWSAPSFGAVLAATGQLRAGAKPEQLFGGLSRSPDEMWEKRRKLAMAAVLEIDKNNRSLFSYMLPYAKIDGYERLSKSVWDMNKPRLMPVDPPAGSQFRRSLVLYAEPMTQPDAMLLNAALTAKAKGKQGFVFIAFKESPNRAQVQIGNLDDPQIAKPLFIEANPVIAELRGVIPSPAEVAVRKAVKH